MILVDTSALHALVSEQDPRHADALELAQALDRDAEDLLIHTYVLCETVALVQRRFGLTLAMRVSDEASRFTTITVDRALHDRGIEWLRAHPSRRTSLVDAVSFVVMRDQGITTAFAFDPDFERAGFQLSRAR